MKVMIYSAFVITGLIFAAVLGIFGQNISYDINERFPTIELSTAITTVTFISIGLFLIIPASLFIFSKTKKHIIVSAIACVLVGLPVSIWSFFVWVAWMG